MSDLMQQLMLPASKHTTCSNMMPTSILHGPSPGPERAPFPHLRGFDRPPSSHMVGCNSTRVCLTAQSRVVQPTTDADTETHQRKYTPTSQVCRKHATHTGLLADPGYLPNAQVNVSLVIIHYRPYPCPPLPLPRTDLCSHAPCSNTQPVTLLHEQSPCCKMV